MKTIPLLKACVILCLMIMPAHGLAQESPNFAELKLKVAEKAIHHQECLKTFESLKTLEKMVGAALASRRLDLIGLCFERYSTCWYLSIAVRHSNDKAFKAEVVVLMLRRKSLFWAHDAWGMNRKLEPPIKDVLKNYLPEENFDSSSIATEETRQQLAGILARALEKSTPAAPGKDPVRDFRKLTLKQADAALNRTMSHRDLSRMAEDAILSRRLDLIEFCLENHYAQGYLYAAMRNTIDLPFKAQVALMMLRSQSAIWPSEIETKGFVPRRPLAEPIRSVLNAYLPEERFDDSAVATEAARFATASKLAPALEKQVRPRPGKRPVEGFVFLPLKQAEAVIKRTKSENDLKELARAALDSKRLELIELCFQNPCTRFALYETLRDVTDFPFKAKVVAAALAWMHRCLM